MGNIYDDYLKSMPEDFFKKISKDHEKHIKIHQQYAKSFYGASLADAFKHELSTLGAQGPQGFNMAYDPEEMYVDEEWTNTHSDNAFPYSVSSAERKLSHIKPDTIRTQKARGVRALIQHQAHGVVNVPNTALIQCAEHIKAAWTLREQTTYFGITSSSRKVFARPCPERPRHGFVDSRRVETFEDVVALYKEAHSADDKSEILLQPMVAAEANYIMTKTTLTFGPGHDGATSGKGAVMLRIPEGPWFAVESYPHITLDDLRNRAAVAKGDDAYIEAVSNKHKLTSCVQVRGGPHVTGSSPDYIPNKRVKVTEVVRLCGNEDLLEWEARASKFIKGTVVYHPTGSITSHYGVHCILNKVPYVTSYEPAVGQTIEPTSASPEVDTDELSLGLLLGMENCVYERAKEFARLSIFSLHNFGADQSAFACRLLGIGAAAMYKLMAATCLGEYRHRDHRIMQGWFKNYGRPSSKLIRKGDIKFVTPGTHREALYRKALAEGARSWRDELMTVARSYLREPWQSGYGGVMWGSCVIGTLRLHDSIAAYQKHPSHTNAKAMFEAMNYAVHLVHNGGGMLCKFIGRSELDRASKGEKAWTLTRVAPFLLEAHKAKAPKTNGTLATAKASKWRARLTPRDLWAAENATKVRDGDELTRYIDELGCHAAYHIRAACALKCPSDCSSVSHHLHIQEIRCYICGVY